MQVLTVHGELNSPEVVNAELHTSGSLAVIAHRLEMEGAKILSRSSNYFRFRGGLGAKFVASKWSFLLSISSGEINVFAKDMQVFASYNIHFDEWALIVLVQFIVFAVAIIYSFGTGFVSNILCLATLFLLPLCYFGISSAFATNRFRELLRSCLIESNQALPNYEK